MCLFLVTITRLIFQCPPKTFREANFRFHFAHTPQYFCDNNTLLFHLRYYEERTCYMTKRRREHDKLHPSTLTITLLHHRIHFSPTIDIELIIKKFRNEYTTTAPNIF